MNSCRQPSPLFRGVVLLAGLATAAGCGGDTENGRAGGSSAGGEYSVEDNTNAPPPNERGSGTIGLRIQQPTTPEGTGPGPVPPSRGERSGSGTSPEDPIGACGPGDSYAYVAQEFQCPGGGNPLAGDVNAGQGARVGNVGANSTGHIIDLYRVPCPDGPVDVYVDMYMCPGGVM